MAKTWSTLNNLNVDQKVLKGGFKVFKSLGILEL